MPGSLPGSMLCVGSSTHWTMCKDNTLYAGDYTLNENIVPNILSHF